MDEYINFMNEINTLWEQYDQPLDYIQEAFDIKSFKKKIVEGFKMMIEWVKKTFQKLKSFSLGKISKIFNQAKKEDTIAGYQALCAANAKVTVNNGFNHNTHVTLMVSAGNNDLTKSDIYDKLINDIELIKDRQANKTEVEAYKLNYRYFSSDNKNIFSTFELSSYLPFRSSRQVSTLEEFYKLVDDLYKIDYTYSYSYDVSDMHWNYGPKEITNKIKEVQGYAEKAENNQKLDLQVVADANDRICKALEGIEFTGEYKQHIDAIISVLNTVNAAKKYIIKKATNANIAHHLDEIKHLETMMAIYNKASTMKNIPQGMNIIINQDGSISFNESAGIFEACILI